jgi:hypothetical protein
MDLWRAVDSEGEILGILVQPRQDTAAALKLIRKLLRKQGFAPSGLGTDKLPSYGAAWRELGCPLIMSKTCGRIIVLRTPIRGATTRTDDAGLPIIRISPALPVCPLRGSHPLQPTTPSYLPPYPSPHQSRGSKPGQLATAGA